jgi:5'-methylthioadenosine phosphorylase
MQPSAPSEEEPAIGVIGGSGLYRLDGLHEVREIPVETPFGAPSDAVVEGRFAGRRVCFLARHGRGHRILPTELNHRANLWALRSLGVRWILAVSAVGSLREHLHPRDIVLPDQFVDRTSRRAEHTFFGNGVVAHVAFADPVCPDLRALVLQAAREHLPDRVVHDGGTYVNMDGPAFSTRAESRFHRLLGADVVGMTNAPEAKLAREAEISLATLAMVTDYDCWKEDETHVTADQVVAHLTANAAAARTLLAAVIPRIPREPGWPTHRSLDGALFTDRALWPADTVERLRPILARFL